MLPSITFDEYADMCGNGGVPQVVAIVWRYPDTRQVVFDEWKGAEMGNKLKVLLSELVFEAELNLGTPQRLNLSNGLGIDVLIKSDGTTKLQINRKDVFPSVNDWRIVLRDWPYPVKAEPKAFEYAGHGYLRACWPAPARMFDGYLTEFVD